MQTPRAHLAIQFSSIHPGDRVRISYAQKTQFYISLPFSLCLSLDKARHFIPHICSFQLMLLISNQVIRPLIALRLLHFLMLVEVKLPGKLQQRRHG